MVKIVLDVVAEDVRDHERQLGLAELEQRAELGQAPLQPLELDEGRTAGHGVVLAVPAVVLQELGQLIPAVRAREQRDVAQRR